MNPTNPSNPSNPMNSINPSNPMNPINPINSMNPMNPINPSNPSNPMNSMNSSNPSNPINPSNPPTPAYYLLYLLTIAAFIACYYSQQESYYSHGYLIPFISAFLIYTKRDVLKVIKPSSDIIGLIIIIFALLLHIFATMGDVNFLSGFAMFFYIIGSSLYLFGREISKEIAFALIFLIFMFPIPPNLLNMAGLPSKALATTIGLKIVDLINIPYLREGFRIHLEHTSLVVGTPCNGMKSIISFLALGLLFLYFTNIKIWLRLVILACIFPLAFVLNGARIAALIYIANYYGIEKASPESYLHTLSGMAVFIIGLVALILFIRISERKKLR